MGGLAEGCALDIDLVCFVKHKVHLCEHALRDVQGTGLGTCCLLGAGHGVRMGGVCDGLTVLKKASR